MSSCAVSVRSICEKIDVRLKAIINESGYPSELKKVLDYALFPGGKRLRPLLFCAWHLQFGELGERAVDFACGIELFHSFTLIHDDMPCIDNDDFRRDKPSVHKAYGESKALLAGDALFALAYSVMLGACKGGQYELVTLISRLFGDNGVIAGQYDDVFCNGANADGVVKIYERKTAALIYGACVCGALFSQVENVDCDTVKRFIADNKLEQINETCFNTGLIVVPAAMYGYNFGVAFQLYDDLSEFLAGERADGASVLEYIEFDKAKKILHDKTNRACSASDDRLLIELAEKFNIE